MSTSARCKQYYSDSLALGTTQPVACNCSPSLDTTLNRTVSSLSLPLLCTAKETLDGSTTGRLNSMSTVTGQLVHRPLASKRPIALHHYPRQSVSETHAHLALSSVCMCVWLTMQAPTCHAQLRLGSQTLSP